MSIIISLVPTKIFMWLFLMLYREAKRAINNFLCLGCNMVIITLGRDGAVFASSDEPRPIHVRPPKVEEVLDTTVRFLLFIRCSYKLSGANRFLLSLNSFTGCWRCICWCISSLFGSISRLSIIPKGWRCRTNCIHVRTTIWHTNQLPTSKRSTFRHRFTEFRLELRLTAQDCHLTQNVLIYIILF